MRRRYAHCLKQRMMPKHRQEVTKSGMIDQASSLRARLRSLKDEIRLQIHLCGMKLVTSLCGLGCETQP